MNSIKIADWIALGRPASGVWSCHVDALVGWHPKREAAPEYIRNLLELWEEANTVLSDPWRAVGVICLEPSSVLETFDDPSGLRLDGLTPPSIYVVHRELEFSDAAEQYYRVAEARFIPELGAGCVGVLRSARSAQAVSHSSEFDNSLYLACPSTMPWLGSSLASVRPAV